MTINPKVIADLRAMFLTGATPSRLIEYLAHCYDGQENWWHFVQMHFREAFFVSLVRIPDELNRIRFVDLSFAHLNADLVHEMIATKHLWDTRPSPSVHSESDWLDSLTATDDVKRFQQYQAAKDPMLANSWSQMEPKAQQYVRRCIGNADGYYERVQILARLAERLQQRIRELEEKLQQQGSIPSSPPSS